MRQQKKPIVTVAHSLPGRLRLRFSCPPESPQKLIAFVHEHPGMSQITYTPLTRSLLVRFDPHAVSQEEIAMRIAFQLALDQGGQPVRLLGSPERVVLQDSAAISAVGLAIAFLQRWLSPTEKGPTRLDWLAGIATLWSVSDHGWKEFRQRGYVDPEVLAVAYLATALIRRNFLTASFITWLTTFGRHLIEVPPAGVEIRPFESRASNGQGPRYELVVGPDTESPDHLWFVGALQGVLKYAMTGGGAHGVRSLWEELREVSRIHGEVLEGSDRMQDGIPIRFR